MEAGAKRATGAQEGGARWWHGSSVKCVNPVFRWLGTAETPQSLVRTKKVSPTPLAASAPNRRSVHAWPTSPLNPSAGYLWTVHKTHLTHLWQVLIGHKTVGAGQVLELCSYSRTDALPGSRASLFPLKSSQHFQRHRPSGVTPES